MKKIRKALCLILCLVISLSFLVSCHGAKDTAEFVVPQNFDENEKYEIVFWAKNDSNPTQVALFEKAVSDFEEIIRILT